LLDPEQDTSHPVSSEWVKAFAIRADGRRAALVPESGSALLVLPTEKGAEADRNLAFDFSTTARPALAFSPDGQWLVWCDRKKLVRRAAVDAAGEAVEPLGSLPHYPGGFCFSPDGQRLLCWGVGRACHLWHLGSAARSRRGGEPPGPPDALVFQ